MEHAERGVEPQSSVESGDPRRLPLVPAYTVVLAANGLWLLASVPGLFSLAGDPDVQQSRWVFESSAYAVLLFAVIVGLVVVLRVRRSELAPTATTLLSIFLALLFPIGTASFIYWLVSVRKRERR